MNDSPRIPDPPSREDRYLGCLLGLATGDALGTTLEFKSPGSFSPIDDIVGGGPFRLNAGEWTDDTSMALCLAESLIEKSGFDPLDQCKRYVDWMRNGHLSSNGTCFDIGGTVSGALAEFRRTGNPFSGPSGKYDAGNGSLMRLAPIPMYYANNPKHAVDLSGESSRTTHQTTACIDACRYMGGLVVVLLNGADKEQVLSPAFHPLGSPVAGWDALSGNRLGFGWVLQNKTTAVHLWIGICGAVPGSRAVGISSFRQLQGRCAARGKPRQRRGHHGSDLWPDGRRVLRSERYSCPLAEKDRPP